MLHAVSMNYDTVLEICIYIYLPRCILCIVTIIYFVFYMPTCVYCIYIVFDANTDVCVLALYLPPDNTRISYLSDCDVHLAPVAPSPRTTSNFFGKLSKLLFVDLHFVRMKRYRQHKYLLCIHI